MRGDLRPDQAEMRVPPERRPGALPGPGTVLALVLLVAAASIRFFRLGAEGLWVDEAWTGLLVRVSPGRLLELLRNDDAPPLFYLLQTLATAVAGMSEWGLRLLPALAGTAAVVAAWRLTRKRAPQAALPVAAALGFSSVAVHYAQQARSYALLHLLAVLALGAALSLRERPGKRTGAWFLLACLGLAYSHNVGILVVAAAVATGVVPLLADGPHRRAGMAVLGLLALGISPWLAALLPQLGTHDAGNAWMAAWWTGRGGLLLGPAYTLAALANGTGAALHLQVPLPTFPSSLAALRWAAWALVVLGLAGAATAAFGSRRPPGGRIAPKGSVANPRSDTQRDLLVGAAIFAAVPLLGLVVISFLVGPAYVVGRTDTLALPGLALLLGIGWTRAASSPWGRLLTPIATISWIVLGIAALAPSWSGEGRTAKGSDRALARLLASEIQPGDAVVFSALSRPTLEYYGRRLGWWDRAGWKGSFPASFDRNAAGSWSAPLDSAATWRQQAIALRLGWEGRDTGTVWLLALRDSDATDQAQGLARSAVAANNQDGVVGGSDPQGGVPPQGGPASQRATVGAWPSRPAPPPSARSRRGAASLGYPGNVLMSVLAGLKPAEVAWEYRQDWVSGDRVVLRLPRSSWVPLDSIPKVETQP